MSASGRDSRPASDRESFIEKHGIRLESQKTVNRGSRLVTRFLIACGLGAVLGLYVGSQAVDALVAALQPPPCNQPDADKDDGELYTSLRV